jgi:hypothetical protein
MSTILTFPTAQAARDYRYLNGTGGWIFAPECCEGRFYPYTESVLFPPEFTPSQIFKHPMTVGRNGHLIGCA